MRLDYPFTKEEVPKVVLKLDKKMVSGPDGFSIAMFQECWDVVKEDSLRVFMEFHNNGVINQLTDATYLALVLKRSQTIKILDFKLINLVTSLYKIIAKVLSGCI